MDTTFRKKPRSGGLRGLFLATLLAVLIILANIATSGKVAALARDAVSPIESLAGKIGGGISASGFFSSHNKLESEISVLQSELQQEQLEAAAYQAVEEENTTLSQMTHLAQTTPGLAVQITSSIISSPYGTFTIDAGSADKVTQGSLVLTADGFVIGKVTQVQMHQSLVAQLFGPGAQTPVTIDGASVVATGQGGAAQAAVPHGMTVGQGDVVIAPEYGGRSVGIVQHVDTNPANAQEAVYIALPVSISSLQFVYVTL